VVLATALDREQEVSALIEAAVCLYLSVDADGRRAK
jgi:hypothetical protein